MIKVNELAEKVIETTGIYSLFDSVAEEYGPLFEAKNEAVAKRSFNQLISKVHNPNDFVLCRFGYFDRNLICIKPSFEKLSTPEVLTYEA